MDITHTCPKLLEITFKRLSLLRNSLLYFDFTILDCCNNSRRTIEDLNSYEMRRIRLFMGGVADLGAAILSWLSSIFPAR